ncbi:hypothetical protein D0Y65_053499 [Glycine soja]|uniref:Helitron helicase-like domain-containing protein n=1 Tax=Glycine soja TaxID=3848 RepID=A0A445F274_GLYSO|nr:hypothetical protein D0Y65_053499 [Glycine soja]
MQNYQHAKRSDSAKARINRKRIMQQKRHGHAQSSSQPTLNCTSEYNMIVSDSSESENSESTQGSGSNFMTPFEDCQSPTNQPVINTEGYSDLGDQLIQCSYCNAQMCQYSRIQNHIVSALSHMLHQHNSYAQSFRMARDRLAADQANNIKLQLIAARGKDGHVYNMPNVPEIAALIVGDFHPDSKRDIIVETQNGELQRIHELHPSYVPLQYPLLFPYGENGYRPDILHRCTSSSKKRKRNRLTMREWFAYRLQSRSNEAQTLLHSRKLFQQFIVEGYTMVESERLSYIRNNQKKLRIDKYSSLQTSLDTGTAKGLTKGKRVILPSTFVGSPHYMDQLYFDDRPDIVSRIFRLKYEHMLSDLTKGQLLEKVVASQNVNIHNDELKEYLDCRKPAVERLYFHLPDQHNIIYEDHDDMDDVLSKSSISDSKFLAWMNTNKDFDEAINLTYSQFVSKFVYNKRNRSWQPRKKGYTIGRLIWVAPTIGELFYLRMMLGSCKGPTSFEDIRTVVNIQYPTYREACFAMGFLQDDKEYVEAIREAKD